jgi:hypothetical protein
MRLAAGGNGAKGLIVSLNELQDKGHGRARFRKRFGGGKRLIHRGTILGS